MFVAIRVAVNSSDLVTHKVSECEKKSGLTKEKLPRHHARVPSVFNDLVVHYVRHELCFSAPDTQSIIGRSREGGALKVIDVCSVLGVPLLSLRRPPGQLLVPQGYSLQPGRASVRLVVQRSVQPLGKEKQRASA